MNNLFTMLQIFILNYRVFTIILFVFLDLLKYFLFVFYLSPFRYKTILKYTDNNNQFYYDRQLCYLNMINIQYIAIPVDLSN